MRVVGLPDRGILYSFSEVFVSASRPVPYTLGYVDLDECDVRILATIVGTPAPADLDKPVGLTVDQDGAWSFTRSPRP